MAKRWMTERELSATKIGRAALAKEKAKSVRKPDSRLKRGPSAIEESMAAQIKEAGLPEPVREHLAITGRKFKIDFAWLRYGNMIGLEVQGAVHRIKPRWKQEHERRAVLMLAGWRILEVNGDDVRSGRALTWLKALLAQ